MAETEKDVRTRLREIALKAPSGSGVYLWKNPDNVILYVGKAKNLKNRLTSYFSAKSLKTRLLVAAASQIDYINTNNEYDALLLENNLIKKHNPRYNIDLKDDKSYPSLCVTTEDFPRLFRTRNIPKNGSRYFGPYPNAGALDQFLEALRHIYPLRRCRRLQRRVNPCMYYHIGECAAPCCGKITKEAYSEYIEEISALLERKEGAVEQKLEDAMKAAAADLNFEKAARIRDGINALGLLHMDIAVQDYDADDRDYIAWADEGELVTFAVLKVRGGKLLGRDLYRTQTLSDDAELTEEFFLAYYGERTGFPPSIYVTNSGQNGAACSSTQNAVSNTQSAGTSTQSAESIPLLTQWFTDTFGSAPGILTGDSPRHTAALNMARQNAAEDIVRRLRERGDMPAMEQLQALLALPALPRRIEGFDIAHLEGKFPVASLITFKDGNPDKKNYRYFRLRTTEGIIDDFASLREAATRRYSRLLRENAPLPDLILIDGGIGQVNTVQGVLDSLAVTVPIIGLAKREEELYRPGNSTPLVLPRRSDALRLLQRVRDETHRFATSRNQRLRAKDAIGELPPTQRRAAFDTEDLAGLALAAEEEPEYGNS